MAATGDFSSRLWSGRQRHGFSAADLLVVTVLRRLEGSGILNDYPTLAAYIARAEARPAYQRAFEARLAVFTGAAPAG